MTLSCVTCGNDDNDSRYAPVVEYKGVLQCSPCLEGIKALEDEDGWYQDPETLRWVNPAAQEPPGQAALREALANHRDTRTIYNVCTTVVALIAADNPEEAQGVLDHAIESAGFDLLSDAGLETQRVLESEPLDSDIEAEVRARKW